jgi:hypothetical protein
MKTAGKLEYHVPAEFDEKRPGFAYKSVKYDMNVANHSLASRLPRAVDSPSLFGSLEEFKPFIRCSEHLIDWKDGSTQIAPSWQFTSSHSRTRHS